jgi:hypothetical protein
MSEYVVGLDLGQAQDYTALAVVRRVVPPWPADTPRTVPISMGYGYTGSMPAKDTREATYELGHLERYPLGTRYGAIVVATCDLLQRAPLSRATPIVIDFTGVGRAVENMYDGTGVRPIAITITGGDEVTRDGPRHLKVPKRDLVSTLDVLFQSERLKIASELEAAPLLVNELLNFRRKVDLKTAHDSYEAWRESVHDDLVLAVALACWYGEHQPRPGRMVL